MTEPALAWTIVVTDGAGLRTLHPAGLGLERAGAIDRAVRGHLFGEVPAAPPSSGPAPTPSDAIRQAARLEAARAQGFTGDICDKCGGSEMRRAGTCLTCQACGSTTGCS